MNKNILALMPVFIFMIIMLIVSIYVRRVPAVWAVLYWR